MEIISRFTENESFVDDFSSIHDRIWRDLENVIDWIDSIRNTDID